MYTNNDTRPDRRVNRYPFTNSQIDDGLAPSVDEMLDFLGAVFIPGDVIELRMLGCVAGNGFRQVVAGYFDHDHFEALAKNAGLWSPKAEGCYVTCNPTMPDLLARAANRVQGKPKRLTSDVEIVRRVILPIDLDAVRPAGVSSTDSEKEAAREMAGELMAEFHRLGWPEPIFNDSGNGYHLVYMVDLPVDDGGLVERVLRAADKRWSDDRVKIDTSLCNPSRIVKLPGTPARKGDSTVERPHRLASVVTSPRTREVVPRELLEAFAPKPAAPAPRTIPAPRSTTRPGGGMSAKERALRCVTSPKFTDSIEGQYGHKALLGAACTARDGFGLDGTEPGTELYDVLAEYNRLKTSSPEGPKQLQHKCKEAIKKFPHPSLRLLNAPPKNGKPSSANGSPTGTTPEIVAVDGGRIRFTNYAKTIENDKSTGEPQTVRAPLSATDIDRLHSEVAGELPYRVADRLFIPGPDYEPVYLETAARLFAFYDDRADVRWSKSG